MRTLFCAIAVAGALSAQANNWGKWGPNDEVGTLNYITPEVVRQAAALVKQGKVYSLAIPLDPGNAIWGTRQVLHFMTATGQNAGRGGAYSDDYLSMPTHGTTHWDSLAHFFGDGKMYNGYDPQKEITSAGVTKNAVGRAANRIVTRGVLLDIARYKGGSLDPRYEITVGDLEGAAQKQNVAVRPGDALLNRTGWLRMWAKDPAAFRATEPGIGWDAGQLLKQKQVAVVASDNLSVESLPAKPETARRAGVPGFENPLHYELIRNQGMMLGEIFNLEELAADGVYEFMFVAQPLNLIKATGSPINPLAIK
jgi:kynurenine formamidase